MTSAMHIKARISPWDDQTFVRAFEQARDEVHLDANQPDGTAAGALVQQRLQNLGFPHARVDVVQTVDEKLAHTSHWLVTRDG